MKSKLTPEEVKELSKRTIWPWLCSNILDWSIIIATFSSYYAWGNPFLLPVVVLIIGNRQHALTILGHEAAHYTLSYSKRVNDLISNFLAFGPVGITTDGYRKLHRMHHGNTNTEEDPELLHRRSRAPQWDLPISLPKILSYCAQDLIGLSAKDYYIIVTFSKSQYLKDYIPLVVCHITFIGVMIFFGAWLVLAVWYLSLFTSFMMFFRLRTFLEHLGTDGTHRVKLNYIQRGVIAPHNIGFHWEHHSYPTIPFHRLPVVRERLDEVAVMSLGELIALYANSTPVASGQVLKGKLI